MTNSQPKLTGKYIFIFALAVFLSWVLHELAHWCTGTYFGYKMGMTLNSTFPLSGIYEKDQDWQIISAGGPLFTLCEAMIVFYLMIRKYRIYLYPFLFTCFYMRLLAAVISFFHPNDEARISMAIGIGKFTLPVVVTVVLFALVYKVSKRYGFSAKFNLINLVLVILFSSIVILTDMYFKIHLW